MDYEAVLCIRVAVPFEAETDVLDPAEHTETVGSLTRIADRASYDKLARKVERQRRAAAKHAVAVVSKQVAEVVAKHGQVVSVAVEEVRER